MEAITGGFLPGRWFSFTLLALAAAGNGGLRAQSVDGGFSPPLFWEQFTAYTFSSGPYRGFPDGSGGVLMVGNGGADVVNGTWYREPIRLVETNGAVDAQFQTEVVGGFAMALQPDGKLLMTSLTDGADMVLRVHPSGAPDTSFTPVGFSQGIRHLTLLPNGQILVLVWGNSFLRPHPAAISVSEPTVFRLNTNGAVDVTFASPTFSWGALLFAPPTRDSLGRLYLGGRFTTVNGAARANVVRLLADGQVDLSFAGAASIPGGLGGIVRRVELQSDGQVVVAGDVRIPSNASSASRLAAIRFDANGVFDATFVTNKVNQLGLTDYPRDMVMRPDDKFVTVSSGLRQFNADGSLDGSFNAVNFPTWAYWLLRFSDGRLLVPGGDPLQGVRLYASNGLQDASFTTGGFGHATPPRSHARLADGGMALGGLFNRVGGQAQLGLALLSTVNGSPSPSQPDLGSLVPEGVMSTFDPVLSKVTAGPSNTCWFLAKVMDTNGLVRVLFGRFLSDGTFDPAVPVQEWNSPGPNGDDLFALGDGQLFVTDNSAQAAVNGAPVRRLLTDGTVDATFAGLEATLRNQLAAITYFVDNSIWSVDVGRLRLLCGSGATNLIAVANTVDGQARLVRLTRDGQLDGGFAAPATTGLSNRWEYPEVFNPLTSNLEYPEARIFDEPVFSDATALPNGQILVCGSFTGLGATAVGYLARLNANGNVDTNFPGVTLSYDRLPFWTPRLGALALDDLGRIYVAGLFDHLNGQPAPGLARLLPDGNLDTNFQSPLSNVLYPDQAVALQVVGKHLYVFGPYSNGGTRRMIWRLQVVEDLRLESRLGSAGGLELIVPAHPTRPTILEASGNLSDWTDVFTNAAGPAFATFADPGLLSAPARYFRLRQ